MLFVINIIVAPKLEKKWLHAGSFFNRAFSLSKLISFDNIRNVIEHLASEFFASCGCFYEEGDDGTPGRQNDRLELWISPS